MTVVSLSIEEKLLEKLDNIKEELGYSGRSEIIRSAIRTFIREKQQIENLKGTNDCLITVNHKNEDLNSISNIQHKHQHIIKTQIHDHLEDHCCLQAYLVHGEAEEIRKFWKNLRSSKKTRDVNITTL